MERVASSESFRPVVVRKEKKKRTARKTQNTFDAIKQRDPERFWELTRKAVQAPRRKDRPLKVAGLPNRMTHSEFAQRKEDARLIVNKVFKIMDIEGSLPENPIARKAMKDALQLLAEDNSTKDRLSIIRTLLEYNMAKPAATQNVNVRTAEDFLDEIASKDGDG